METQPPSAKRGRAPSRILRVEVENFEIGSEVRALPVIASFVALEQQIIVVKTRSESVRFRNGGDITD